MQLRSLSSNPDRSTDPEPGNTPRRPVSVLAVGDVFPDVPDARSAFRPLRAVVRVGRHRVRQLRRGLLGSPGHVAEPQALHGSAPGTRCDARRGRLRRDDLRQQPHARRWLRRARGHARAPARAGHRRHRGREGPRRGDASRDASSATACASRSSASAASTRSATRRGRRGQGSHRCGCGRFYADPDPNFWEPGIEPVITTMPVPEDLERFRSGDRASAGRGGLPRRRVPLGLLELGRGLAGLRARARPRRG